MCTERGIVRRTKVEFGWAGQPTLLILLLVGRGQKPSQSQDSRKTAHYRHVMIQGVAQVAIRSLHSAQNAVEAITASRLRPTKKGLGTYGVSCLRSS